jgi:glucose/arabinose dehydrogenase
MAVSILSIDEKELRSVRPWETIFLGDAEPVGPNESGGGRIAVGADDKLYLTIGDYGITDPQVSQDPSLSFGKIAEIDLETKSHRFLSSGHRNPQGLVVTRPGFKLWLRGATSSRRACRLCHAALRMGAVDRADQRN